MGITIYGCEQDEAVLFRELARRSAGVVDIDAQKPMKADLVFVDEFVPGVRCDAKYATWDNFTGKPVDGYLANRIVGTRALCGALERAREAAEQKLRRQRLPVQLLPQQGVRPLVRG